MQCALVKIDSKHRVVLTKRVRLQAGFNSGDTLFAFGTDGFVVLRKFKILH